MTTRKTIALTISTFEIGKEMSGRVARTRSGGDSDGIQMRLRSAAEPGGVRQVGFGPLRKAEIWSLFWNACGWGGESLGWSEGSRAREEVLLRPVLSWAVSPHSGGPYLLWCPLWASLWDPRALLCGSPFTGEGNSNPLQYSCLENPMDGGAWWAAVHGVAKSRHDWVTSLSLFTFMHWRRKWQPTPVFLPGESQGQRSLAGCHLWGRTESDMTEAT